MEINKLTFAYFSPTLSTRRLILHVVWGLGYRVPTQTINITGVSQREKETRLGSDELLVVGVPTYGGRLPNVRPSLFENFIGNNTPVLPVVVYGDRGYDDTLLEMVNDLQVRGFIPVGAGAMIAEHAYTDKVGAGRPDQSDVAAANQLGVLVREKLDSIPSPEYLPEYAVTGIPGNIPYKDLPPSLPVAPITNENCVLCMLCWRWCPTNAIAYNDPKSTDAAKCIRCQGCVKRCPPKARQIENEGFLARVAAMEENFSGVRHEPELFV